MIHRHIHQPRPTRLLSPAMVLHQEVMRQVGAIVLGEGDDGKPITVEHVLRFSFDHLLEGADESTQAQVIAFQESRAALDKLIMGMEKTAKNPEVWDRTYVVKNSLLAQQLKVYAGLVLFFQQGKFSPTELNAIANLQGQANAIGTIIKQVGAPVIRR